MAARESNSHVFRLVALPAPSDREKSQMYIQRYMQHFPAAGEIVIFDRSWYNRLGVEYVMGFCTCMKEQHRRFLQFCPEMEQYIVEGGIKLIKVWLDVSDKVGVQWAADWIARDSGRISPCIELKIQRMQCSFCAQQRN